MAGNDPRAPSFSAGLVRRRPERAADGEFRFDLFCGSRPPGEDLAALDAPLRERLMRQQVFGQQGSEDAMTVPDRLALPLAAASAATRTAAASCAKNKVSRPARDCPR